MRGSALFAIVGVGLFAFLLVGNAVAPTPVFNNEKIPSEQIQSNNVLIDCENFSDCENQLDDFFINSVIISDTTFTESNDDLLTRWAEQLGVTDVSALVIESSIILRDSNENQFATSGFFSPTQVPGTLVDKAGNLLDLGEIRVGVFAISTSGDAQLNLVGKIKFFLDDDRVSTKILSTDQLTTDSKARMFIADKAFPSFSKQNEEFKFGFSDEQNDWIDGSTHFYRVFITEMKGTVNTNTASTEFDWKGKQLIYELEMKFDKSKEVITFEDDIGIKAESVFKTDSEIRTCGTGQDSWLWTSAKKRLTTLGIDSLPLKIELEDGTILNLDGGKRGAAGAFSLSPMQGKTDCDVLLVQRNQEVKITVNPTDGVNYNSKLPTSDPINVNFPIAQKNISLVCTEGGNYAPNGLSRVNCKGTSELEDYEVSVFNYYIELGCAVNRGGTGTASANCAIQADDYLVSEAFKETIPSKRGWYQQFLDYKESLMNNEIKFDYTGF